MDENNRNVLPQEPADPFSSPRPADPFSSAQPADPFSAARPADPFSSAGPADPFSSAGPADPYAGMQEQNPDSYGAPGYDPYLVRYEPRPQTEETAVSVSKKKSHAGMIIGIICAVLLVGTGIVLWQLGFFTSRNGTYVWDDYKVFGITAEITIDGDSAKVTVNSTITNDTRTVECGVEFTWDTITLVQEDGSILVCDYDRKAGKIISRDDTYVNSDIEFEKE